MKNNMNSNEQLLKKGVCTLLQRISLKNVVGLGLLVSAKVTVAGAYLGYALAVGTIVEWFAC